jgi:hypothetical protein
MKKLTLLLLMLCASSAWAGSLRVTVIAPHSDAEWMITGEMAPEPAYPVGMGIVSNPYIVSLSWTNGSGCGITVNGSTSTCYSNVYECQGTCTVATGTWAKIGSTATGATTYQDSAPDAGGTDSYYVTDVATGAGWNGAESGASNDAAPDGYPIRLTIDRVYTGTFKYECGISAHSERYTYELHGRSEYDCGKLPAPHQAYWSRESQQGALSVTLLNPQDNQNSMQYVDIVLNSQPDEYRGKLDVNKTTFVIDSKSSM